MASAWSWETSKRFTETFLVYLRQVLAKSDRKVIKYSTGCIAATSLCCYLRATTLKKHGDIEQSSNSSTIHQLQNTRRNNQKSSKTHKLIVSSLQKLTPSRLNILPSYKTFHSFATPQFVKRASVNAAERKTDADTNADTPEREPVSKICIVSRNISVLFLIFIGINSSLHFINIP